MFTWAMRHVVWFIIRIAVTLLCLFTIKRTIHTQGYYVSYEVLLVCAVCFIVGVRFWIPTCKDNQSTTVDKER